MADLPRHVRVVIIGSGPAGLTAAIYAARAAMPPLLIEGLGVGGPPGGQLALTTDVENYPGFAEGILGPELMAAMRAQAERFGTELVQGDVERVDLSRRPFTIEGTGIDPFAYTCDGLIIATGARPRRLGLEAETRLWGARGVTACATCDGLFYADEDVVVVGGGDTAMEEALYLAKICRSVTVIHRRHEFRASAIMLGRARENTKIRWQVPMVVEEILVDERDYVRGARLKNVENGKVCEIAAKGFFLAIGHEPNTSLFRGQIDLDAEGWIVAGGKSSTATSVPGVFAAGDCADRTYRQAVTAAGSGCMAAIDAARFLSH